MTHAYPKLHNAMWPGLVGKEDGTDHPPISLDRMLELTAKAEVNGQKFEGVDLFLFHPHTDPDASDDTLKAMADKIAGLGLAVGSLVAPVWPGTVGGSAIVGAMSIVFIVRSWAVCASGNDAPSPALSCSRLSSSPATSSRANGSDSVPRSAMRMCPVSSLTIRTRASLSLVNPTAARWREPRFGSGMSAGSASGNCTPAA